MDEDDDDEARKVDGDVDGDDYEADNSQALDDVLYPVDLVNGDTHAE